MRLARARSSVYAALNFILFILSVIILLYIFTWCSEKSRYEGVQRIRTEAEQLWAAVGFLDTERHQRADKPLDGVWQPVGGARSLFYVYSAYVEDRVIAAVRIISVSLTTHTDPVYCKIWLSDDRTFVMKGKVKVIHDHDGLKYSATYVLCLLNEVGVKPEETVGATISVLASSAVHRPPTNLLTVLDTKPKSGIQGQLHVCVKPFLRYYLRPEWLVEWFELNRILGASHFYMYENQAHLNEQISCVLKYYRKKGLVTLLPWNLLLVSDTTISDRGRYAAFNDCLYRSMLNADWLLVIDSDKIVVPRHEPTLQALLTTLKTLYSSQEKEPSAFLFRNAFFYLKWEDDPRGMASLVTASKTRRSTALHEFRNRSKYMVRPRDAVELGKNFVWEFMPGVTSEGVAIDRALLHHYMVHCEFGNPDCLSVPTTVDRSAHRWIEELYHRVENVRTQLKLVCPR